MERVFLLHLEMPGADRRRLSETLPVPNDVLKKLGKFDRLYHCPAGDLVGFIIETTKHAGQIKAALELGPKAAGGGVVGSALRSGDKFMILEIGQEFTWRGVGVIDAYLRHRAAPPKGETTG